MTNNETMPTMPAEFPLPTTPCVLVMTYTDQTWLYYSTRDRPVLSMGMGSPYIDFPLPLRGRDLKPLLQSPDPRVSECDWWVYDMRPSDRQVLIAYDTGDGRGGYERWAQAVLIGSEELIYALWTRWKSHALDNLTHKTLHSLVGPSLETWEARTKKLLQRHELTETQRRRRIEALLRKHGLDERSWNRRRDKFLRAHRRTLGDQERLTRRLEEQYIETARATTAQEHPDLLLSPPPPSSWVAEKGLPPHVRTDDRFAAPVDSLGDGSREAMMKKIFATFRSRSRPRES